MDDELDVYGPNGTETLTFVDDDEVLPAATQDSHFDFENDFSLPTQTSQTERSLVTGVDASQDLTFHDVDEEEVEEEEFFHERKLPDHACRYCGISDTKCVAKCTVCDKWFCNGKIGTTGSHLVNHMVKSQHKEVILHKESPLEDTQLECYLCASKNVFQLGFIPAKADSVVILLCRFPCAQTASQKDPSWQNDDWKPLIAEKQLLSWIVYFPSEQLLMRARQITNKQAMRLEEVWREHPNATLEDLDKPGIDREPDPVCLRYDDAFHYRRIFAPLVREEAEYDRRMTESQTQNVGQVRWEQGLSRKHLAFFHLPKFTDGSMKLMIGDELRLKHTQTVDGSEWTCTGQVFKIPDNHTDEIGLEIRDRSTDKIPNEQRIMFTCEAVWNSTSFDRMIGALGKLEKDQACVSQFIYHKMMGREINELAFKIHPPKRLSVPGLPELNHSQMQAVRQVLTRPLSLIQGPPGTGKTVTSASIVYHLVQQTQAQVLVCAPSNIAVDQLAEKINLTGLKVVRVCAKSREGLESGMNFLGLHTQLKTLRGAHELHKLMQLKEEVGELSATDQAHFVRLRKTKEAEILAAADVICCTCSSAADPRLSKLKIKCVLVDESTQATEPEVLVSIVRGVRQLILVGDHCQLGPVILCKKAARAGLQQSLFERLVLLNNHPIRLEVQYRMHPALSAFPSNVFYEGSLQNGVSENDRQLRGVDWEWPVHGSPTMFWSCYGTEEMSSSGTSFLNRTEAANVEKLTSKLIKGGMSPSQIGVITPYEGQRSYIVQYMHDQGSLNSKLYEHLEIANVDAFQGREKDFIIVTCVRSNDNSGIGFLNDPRRLNVALTRAKYGLIIIGNGKVLARQQLWNDLLMTYKQKGLIFEGPINNLKCVDLVLPKPKPQAINPAFPAGRYGTQRHSYTLQEYRGGSGNVRGPFTYADTHNMIAERTAAMRQASARLPVPIHMLNTSFPVPHMPPKDRRRGGPPPTTWSKQGISRGGQLSQSDNNFFTSQASQDPIGHDVGFLEGSLSGFSQSQSAAARYTQPVSQDDYRGMALGEDIVTDMENLLLSQNP
ncbi:unnamed protein product [Caenorhabditis auriculariae]|uniref:DNA helicase n=1 Tax=Caenorhabditis auriculariae TaxID=2777116 RepID=A0A8S1GTN2_9PELO|nr:unnamed protein product [Caenorhabditis auriculariae]